MTRSITGRDGYLVAQALVYTSEFLACLPALHDEPCNRLDMDDLLGATQSKSFLEHYRRLAREKLAAVNLAPRHDAPCQSRQQEGTGSKNTQRMNWTPGECP